MNRAEVKWCIAHYNMTQVDIARRIAELEARIAAPIPAQTNAFGNRLCDRDELRFLREELASNVAVQP